jgi:minor extracellular serine protease Vpr
MKTSFRPWLTVLCLLAVVATSLIPVSGATVGAVSAKVTGSPDSLTAAIAAASIHTADGRVRVIVQLSDPPLAAYQGGIASLAGTSSYNKSLDVDSPSSVATINHLQAAQRAFVNTLDQAIPGTEVVASFQVAFNGLSLAVDPAQLDQLQALSGVVKVFPDQLRSVDSDASLPLINAPVLWTALGGQPTPAEQLIKGGQPVPGKGIRIAIIDTGIRPANPMFSGTDYDNNALPGYPKGFCATYPLSADFKCNGKIIAANVFWDASLSLSAEEVNTPVDIDGHGSHTAGTAAGNPVLAKAGQGVAVDSIISGVAPGAYLMIYKALFENAAHSGASGSDTSLVLALNEALADGAQVISNSWGSASVIDPALSVEKPVIDTITAAGVLVVFSAGNSGPTAGTVSCPGCVESALTVASSTTGRIFANPLSVTGPGSVLASLTDQAALQGNGPALSADITAPLKVFPTSTDGCKAFPAGSETGSVALVTRGSCTFLIKVANAAAAGATAVVVSNNLSGEPVMMELRGSTIPAVMVDQAAGLSLINWVTANPTATVHLGAAFARINNPDWQDVVSDFSSAGPNGNPDVLKPDIAAPGQMILSAFSPALITGASDPYYALLEGTSMAAPHVAGAAALLLQRHPDWTPIQIKTTLTSTSNPALARFDAAAQALKSADPFSMGAGRLDLGTAAQAGLTFDRSSFANHNCVVVCTWTGMLKNVTPTVETWTALLSSSAGLILSVEPASATLSAGDTSSFKVTADVSGSTVGSWVFGRITWKGASGAYAAASQPVAVMAAAASNPDAISLSVDKATYQVGDTLTYNLTLGNIYPVDAIYTLTDTLPARTQYVPDSATGGLVYDTLANSMKVITPKIPGLVADVAPTDKPTLYTLHSLTAQDVNLNQSCTSACDNTWTTLTPVDFYYMGVHYSSITVFSSGFLVPGKAPANLLDTTTPQMLPTQSGLNNIIAPLWGHLVMKSSSPTDTHTGVWMVWQSGGYTVFDWQNAQSSTDPLKKYSFQVWIKNGTGEITFAYGVLGDMTTEAFSVGMENNTGTQGKSYYSSNGGIPTGTAPVVGTDLAVLNAMTFVPLSFKVKVLSASIFQPSILNVAIATDDQASSDLFTASAHSDLQVYLGFFPFMGK